MREVAGLHRQQGAVIITVALLTLFLLGFMGIALDFGRLFVVKTELQTAMDSCALAAAQELDGAADALTRATNAGKAAGNLNKVHFQSAAAGVIDEEITFSDTLIGTYSHTFTPVASAKYAKCTHTRSGMAPWLLQAMTAFSGNAAYSATQGVQALGIATRAPAQSNCALPIAVCEKPGGYQPGEWFGGLVNADESVTGQFRWVDFTGSGGGAKELKDVLRGEGQCQLPANNTLVGKPGGNSGAAIAYNTRFGIYQGSGKPPNLPEDGVPDLTGYAWYLDAPPVQPPYPNKYSSAGGYVDKREINAPYQGDKQSPDTLGLQTVGKAFTGLATAGANDRRIVPLPVVDCAAFDGLSGSATLKISSLACVLLLHPVKQGSASKSEKMWLEYVGAASDADSPCAGLGLAGGPGGPLVPVLVQ
jgi:hypothetical protein